MNSLDEMRHNAQNGLGYCDGCPAQEATDGEYVNPGLFDYDAEVMFVTMDPSHDPHWERHETWEEYNRECTERFKTWSGYDPLQTILRPLDGVSLEEGAWVADSIKCPVDNSRRRVNESEISETFDHCRHYLRREIDEVDPTVIVTLGTDSGERVLAEYFDLGVSLSPGSSDCGRVFGRLEPPVVISPHWFHGWLGRTTNGMKNVDIVKEKLRSVYTDQRGTDS